MVQDLIRVNTGPATGSNVTLGVGDKPVTPNLRSTWSPLPEPRPLRTTLHQMEYYPLIWSRAGLGILEMVHL